MSAVCGHFACEVGAETQYASNCFNVPELHTATAKSK